MKRFKIIEGNEAFQKLNEFSSQSIINPETIKLGWYSGGLGQDRPQHYFRFQIDQKGLNQLKVKLKLVEQKDREIYKAYRSQLIDNRFKEGLSSWWQPPMSETEGIFYLGELEGRATCSVQFVYVKLNNTGYLAIRCG